MATVFFRENPPVANCAMLTTFFSGSPDLLFAFLAAGSLVPCINCAMVVSLFTLKDLLIYRIKQISAF